MSDKERFKEYEMLMPMVAAHVGLPAPSGPDDVDAYLPYIARMRDEGCRVLLKIDGPRSGKSQYTAVASGTPLGEECFHTDAPSLAMAAAFVVVSYARACWGFVR